jgi:hypothetical protein
MGGRREFEKTHTDEVNVGPNRHGVRGGDPVDFRPRCVRTLSKTILPPGDTSVEAVRCPFARDSIYGVRKAPITKRYMRHREDKLLSFRKTILTEKELFLGLRSLSISIDVPRHVERRKG